MSCPRGGVGVAALGGMIYAVGGHDGTSYLNTVEAYDPLNQSWEIATGISSRRAGAGIAVVACCVKSLKDITKVNNAPTVDSIADMSSAPRGMKCVVKCSIYKRTSVVFGSDPSAINNPGAGAMGEDDTRSVTSNSSLTSSVSAPAGSSPAKTLHSGTAAAASVTVVTKRNSIGNV